MAQHQQPNALRVRVLCLSTYNGLERRFSRRPLLLVGDFGALVSLRPLAAMSWQRPNIGSRVTREGHARFWEQPEVKVLRLTRQSQRLLIVSLQGAAVALWWDFSRIT